MLLKGHICIGGQLIFILSCMAFVLLSSCLFSSIFPLMPFVLPLTPHPIFVLPQTFSLNIFSVGSSGQRCFHLKIPSGTCSVHDGKKRKKIKGKSGRIISWEISISPLLLNSLHKSRDACLRYYNLAHKRLSRYSK